MAHPEPNNKLFSYFIVMGVSASQEEITHKNINDGKIVPTFLDVYPPFPIDGPPQYLEKFETLSFYDGFKIYNEDFETIYSDQNTLELKSQKSQSEKPENLKDRATICEKIYSSVMTDGDSNRRYCSTFLFYEKFYVKRDEAFTKKEKGSTLMPKTSLQDLIKYPYTMNDYDLIFLPKSITLVSSRPCFDTQRQILNYMYKNLFAKSQTPREVNIPKKLVEWLESIITKQKGDGDIDEIWQQWFSSQSHFPTKVNSNEENIVIKEPHLKEFYVSVMFSLMDIGKYPFEKVLLKMNKDEKNEELARFRKPPQNGVDLPDFDYRYLFQKLSVETIIQIFKCIVLERQIIIFSNTPGDIPFVTEAIFGLIPPLKWCCMYVPFFPVFLWEHLHALFPYIVGMASEHKQFIGSNIDLTDKVIIDLDSNSIYTPDSVPELPKAVNDYLTTKLTELFSQVQTHASAPVSHDGVWAEVTLKMRHSFHIVLLSLINNYLPFFSLPEEFDPEIRYTSAEVFNSEAYFANVPQEDHAYINEMHNTMMFTNFLAETFDITHIYETGKAEMPALKYEELSLFIQQMRDVITLKNQLFPTDVQAGQEDNNPFIDILHPSILSKLDAENSELVKESMKRYYNPIKVDLFPYLVKYYYQFIDPKRAGVNQIAAPQPSSAKKAHHARHTSLASLVSVNGEDTKTLNKSLQNFKTLNKNKIVNLNRMFSKPSAATRRGIHKSLDMMQMFTNTLAQGNLHSSNESKCSDRSHYQDNDNASVKNEDDNRSVYEKKSVYEHDDLEGLSRKSSAVVTESKPEIVKRVMQKLDSEEFTFKPNPKRKSTAASKMTSSLKPKPAQINEADEFALEEIEKRAVQSYGGNMCYDKEKSP